MVLGVCGKIASGKSEVLKILWQRGFVCIDADEIVHELYRSGGEGARVVAEIFGKEYLGEDGGVDRVALRELVFQDAGCLESLNKAVHPLVYAEIERWMVVQSEDADKAIEAAYFEEDFLGRVIDKVVWVERDEREIVKCLIEERDFSEERAKRAVLLIKKPEKIDFLVKNDKGLLKLKKEVDCLFIRK